MRRALRTLSLILTGCISLLGFQNALAWGSVGHRLTATVANHYLSDALKPELLRILQQHPRFQQDFLDKMPRSIAQGSEEDRFDWLLGQAAVWPDTTRGLPEAERDRFNRANWHYIDGAWLRGESQIQGNSYIGVAPFDDIHGQVVLEESEVANVMNALDYNSRVLADRQATLAQRAVALCWLLHLVGDIHQPLHVGSLYSAERFKNGDRGGNGIQTDDGNLHARWDRALRDDGIRTNFDALLAQHSATLEGMDRLDDADFSRWMSESRALLLNTVYTEEMKSAIARSDSSNRRLGEFDLDDDYVASMQYHARLRIALAGRRLALWFGENL